MGWRELSLASFLGAQERSQRGSASRRMVTRTELFPLLKELSSTSYLLMTVRVKATLDLSVLEPSSV